MKKIFLFLAIATALLSLQEGSAFSVIATPAPGTYDTPQTIQLFSDVADAKIFYGTNPDGGPESLSEYTTGITLSHNTTLVWYALSPSLQSSTPISIETYTITPAPSLAQEQIGKNLAASVQDAQKTSSPLLLILALGSICMLGCGIFFRRTPIGLRLATQISNYSRRKWDSLKKPTK